MIIKLANRFFSLFGYRLSQKQDPLPADIQNDAEFMELYQRCKPFTMTSIERMYTLFESIKYTFKNQLPGDFVECGVWKGGSSLLIALMLKKYEAFDRKLYMYDTFEGMSEPTEEDRAVSGESAEQLLKEQDKSVQESVWCYSTIDEVRANLTLSGFPLENMHFVKGKVEDTLPEIKPNKIALLRLDTDWYESTKIELELLYDRLAHNGILIIDDFGHWEGAKKAVIEYFYKRNVNPFINRIDYTGRLIIKNQ